MYLNPRGDYEEGWLTLDNEQGKAKRYVCKGEARNAAVVRLSVSNTGAVTVNVGEDGMALLAPDNLPDRVTVHHPSPGQHTPRVPGVGGATWASEWEYEWNGN